MLTKVAVVAAVMFSVASQLVAQDPTAIADSLTRQWLAAYNTGRPDRLADLVTDDVLLMLPGRAPVRGRAAFRETYAADIRGTRRRTLSTTSYRVEQSGDLLVDTGKWSFDGISSDGATVHLEGNYVTVWKTVAGQWKTAIDISNRQASDPR